MQLQAAEALGRLVAAAQELRGQLLGVLRERASVLFADRFQCSDRCIRVSNPKSARTRRYVVVVAGDQVARSRDPHEPEELGNLPSHQVAGVALETFARSAALVRVPRRLSGRLNLANVARWIRGQYPNQVDRERPWAPMIGVGSAWDSYYPGWGLGRPKELRSRYNLSLEGFFGMGSFRHVPGEPWANLNANLAEHTQRVLASLTQPEADALRARYGELDTMETMELFLRDAPLEVDLRRLPAHVSQLRVILAPDNDEVRELRMIRPTEFVPRSDRACGDSFLDIFIESSSIHEIDVMVANRVGVGSFRIVGIRPHGSAHLRAGVDWIGEAH